MDYETSKILCREQIRSIASLVRKILKIKTIMFPVMKVLEYLVKKYENNLVFFS